MAPAVVPDAHPSGVQHVLNGLNEGLHLIVTGNPVIVDTTLRTLRLAFEATLIGALVGVPIGCAIGLGRSRSARMARGLANGVVRVPPVAVGLLVVMILTQASPWGGGPLADLHWYGTNNAAYLAQTLLAVPLMLALTASAVQSVPDGLLDQARAYGAPGWRRAVLAVRESRRRMLAALLVTIGVTITAIGAMVVANAPLTVRAVTSQGSYNPQPPTLALGAFQAISSAGASGTDTDQVPAATAATLNDPTAALGVAYATVLLGLFVLIAAGLTLIQQRRTQWIPGLLS